MPQGTSSPELDTAPKFRRIVAWVADLMVAVAVSQVVLGLIGYFVPPETASSMVPSLSVGMAIGFAYIGFATPLLGNTLGKWMFGLKIVGYQDQVPRWLIRTLFTALWPINGFILLFSKSGRHWGDSAARTRVVLLQPTRPFWMGLVGAAVVSFCALRIGSLGMKLAIMNSTACHTAKAHLEKEHSDGKVSTLPTGFQIVNDQALFDFEVSGEYDRVILERVGTTWQVTKSERILDPSTGASISFGTGSQSND